MKNLVFVNKSWSAVLLFFLIITRSVGQNDTIYHDALYTYGSILSKDESTACYIEYKIGSNDVLHLLDTRSFSLMDSIVLPAQPQSEYMSWKLDFLGNSQKYITVSKKQIPDRLEWRDTVYIFNLEERKFDDHKFFSDNVIDYSYKHKEFIVGTNDFKGRIPREKNDILKTHIKSTIEFGKNKIKYPGQVFDIQISPDENYAVLIFFTHFTKNTPNFVIESRRLKDLELTSSVRIQNIPEKVFFSETGNELLLIKQWRINEHNSDEDYNLLNFPDLTRIEKAHNGIKVKGRLENNTLWLNKFGVKSIDYNSKRVLSDIKIAAYAYPFSREIDVTNFHKIEDTLLVFGGHRVFKYPIIDNELLNIQKNIVEFEKLKIDSIPRIMTNSFPTYNVYLKLNEDNENYTIVYHNRKFTIWDKRTFRKVHEQLLVNDISIDTEQPELFVQTKDLKIIAYHYPDNLSQGNFAYLEYLDFDERNVKRGKFFISSNSSSFNETIFEGETYPIVGKWKFYHLEGLNQWVCFDGKKTLWLFYPNYQDVVKETEQFDWIKDLNEIFPGGFYFQKVYEFNNEPKLIRQIPNSNEFLIKESPKSGLSVLDMTSFKFKTIPNSKNVEPTYFFSSDEVLYTAQDTTYIFNFKNGTNQLLPLRISGELSSTKKEGNKTTLLYNSDDSTKIFLLNNETNEVLESFQVPYELWPKFLFDYPIITYFNSGKPSNLNVISKEIKDWKVLGLDEPDTQKEFLGTSKDNIFLFKNCYVNLGNLEIEKMENYSEVLASTRLVKNDSTFFYTWAFNSNKVLNPKRERNLKYWANNFDSDSNNKIQSKTHPIPERIYWDLNHLYVSNDGNFITGIDKISNFYSERIAVLNRLNHSYKIMNYQNLGAILKNSGFQRTPTNFDNVSMSDDGKYILIHVNSIDYGSMDIELMEKTFLLDIENLKMIHRFPFRIHQITNNNKVLYSKSNELDTPQLYFGNLIDGKIENTGYFFSNNKNFFKYDQNLNLFFSFFEGKLLVYNYPQKSPIKYIDLLSNENIVSVNSDAYNIYVTLNNGSCKIIDARSLQLKVTLELYNNKDTISYIFITPEGYFSAPKEVIRNFHFVKGLETYPLLNYEIFLNRPDIILERLGFADQASIDIYKQAYLRRLERNNLSPEIDILDIPAPNIELTNRSLIPKSTTNTELILKLKTSEDSQKVTTYINSVPVVSTLTKGNIILNFEQKIILNEGDNKISIIARNQNGVESDPINLEITNTNPVQESKTYFIGIGVSKYQDSTMNLTYADKDVHALTKVFKDMYGENLVIDTLTNSSATISNIAALKFRLRNTTVNDRVILSFSGHGLVDENFDFYFSPYEMDFSKAALSGFSYDQMQDLLTDIPARKKLMLIDACHSGELDNEEEYRSAIVENSNVSSSIPKGVKGSIAIGDKESGNLQNSFDLMKSLFYDLDRGNGSYVISAAGGLEYAFEDKTWNNGVFTYSIIQGLKELSSKRNGNDGVITVSELKNYVENKVQALTEGHQKPTSRAENIEWDWQLN